MHSHTSTHAVPDPRATSILHQQVHPLTQADSIDSTCITHMDIAVDLWDSHPINYDPDDPEITVIFPHVILNNPTQSTMSQGGKQIERATIPESYPQGDLLVQSSALQHKTRPYQNLDPNITINSPYKEIMKAVKPLRSNEENKIWNDMANRFNHVGQRTAMGVQTVFGKLVPELSGSGKRKAVEIEGPDAMQEREERKHTKISAKAAVLEIRRKKEEEQESVVGTSLSSPSLASMSNSNASSMESLVNCLDNTTTGATDPTNESESEDDSESEEPGGIDVELYEMQKKTPTIDFEVRYRKKSPEALGLDNTVTNLNHADVVIWKAFQTQYTCNGQHEPRLKADLPVIDAQKLVNIIEDRHSSQTAYDMLGYKDVSQDKITMLPPGGFIINDVNGIPLVAHFPGIYRKAQVDFYNTALVKLRLATKQLNVNKSQSDTGRGRRGDLSTYVTGPKRPLEKFPIGTLNLASGWISEGQKADTPRPSQHMISGGGAPVSGFQAVQEHFRDISSLLMLQNYVLFKLSPESFWAHLKVRTTLHQHFPAIRSVGANDPSLMSGRSYISNRHTNQHFDEKEPAKGLGVKFSYLPGSMTFIRGRLIKHGVTDWDGKGNRFCIANFNHLSEWKAAGVEPVF